MASVYTCTTEGLIRPATPTFYLTFDPDFFGERVGEKNVRRTQHAGVASPEGRPSLYEHAAEAGVGHFQCVVARPMGSSSGTLHRSGPRRRSHQTGRQRNAEAADNGGFQLLVSS